MFGWSNYHFYDNSPPVKSGAGFTLIELLVVIAIIGLLASVVLVSLNGARQKARVTKRLADLKQLTTALELYYNDNNIYPNPGWGWRSVCAGWGGYSANQVIPGLVPNYLSSFPNDPFMNASTNQNCYLYLSNGTDYKVLDYSLSDMTLAQINQNMAFKDPTRNDQWDPCKNGDTNLAMSIYSPGGRCW